MANSMGKTEIARIDSKGRLQISSGYRDFLGLKPGSEVLVSLDDENNVIILTPSAEKSLVKLKIGISDAPGSLAKMASLLAKNGVDLVATESRSISRGKNAEWRVTCSADSVRDLKSLKKRILDAGAKSFSSKKI